MVMMIRSDVVLLLLLCNIIWPVSMSVFYKKSSVISLHTVIIIMQYHVAGMHVGIFLKRWCNFLCCCSLFFHHHHHNNNNNLPHLLHLTMTEHMSKEELVTKLQAACRLYHDEKRSTSEWMDSFVKYSKEIRLQIAKAVGKQCRTIHIANWIKNYFRIRDQYYLTHFGAVTRENQCALHRKHFMERNKPHYEDLDFKGQDDFNLSAASNFGVLYLIKRLDQKKLDRVRKNNNICLIFVCQASSNIIIISVTGVHTNI